jgi:hypothetical protein
MADIPAPLTYGTIVGYFSQILPDANIGSNPAPDYSPLQGNVRITPTVPIVRVIGVTPPRFMTLGPIDCTIDSTGELRGPDGEAGVAVLATNSSGTQPAGIQYIAAFTLNNGVKIPNMTFNVMSGEVVNLATAATFAQPAVVTVVSDQSRVAAEFAATRAETAAATVAQKVLVLANGVAVPPTTPAGTAIVRY